MNHGNLGTPDTQDPNDSTGHGKTQSDNIPTAVPQISRGIPMQKIKAAVIFLVLTITLTGCSSTSNTTQGNFSNMEYPYRVSHERRNQIINSVSKIRVGMTIDEVQKFAGAPDSILPLYEPQMKTPQQIGKTFWYFIRIDAPDRRADAALVRVSTDLNGMVTKLEHWGFEPAPEVAQ